MLDHNPVVKDFIHRPQEYIALAVANKILKDA
jgi:hypothetical protein